MPKDWPGIVLSDVCMPGCSGIDLMTLFHQDDDLLPILLITGHGDVPMAVEAVKKGLGFPAKADRSGQTAHAGGRRAASEAIGYRPSPVLSAKLQVELIGRSQWTVGIASAFSSWQKRILRYGFTASRTGRMTGALPAPVRTAR